MTGPGQHVLALAAGLHPVTTLGSGDSGAGPHTTACWVMWGVEVLLIIAVMAAAGRLAFGRACPPRPLSRRAIGGGVAVLCLVCAVSITNTLVLA